MLFKKLKVPSLLWVCIAFTSNLNADSYTSGHHCSKPIKPYEFNHGYELDNFKDEVETYKQCISDFVEEQNQEAKNHREAAEEAIEEWNNYQSYELN